MSRSKKWSDRAFFGMNVAVESWETGVDRRLLNECNWYRVPVVNKHLAADAMGEVEPLEEDADMMSENRRGCS